MNSPTCSKCDCVKGCSANLSLCPILVAECIASSQVSAAQHRVLDAAIVQPEQTAHEVKNSPYEKIKKLCRLYLDDEQGRYRASAIFTQIFAAAVAAQPEQTAPVFYQFQTKDGKWHAFSDEAHYRNTVEDGRWPIRALYTSPQVAQPEQQTPIRQPLSDRDDAWFTACLEIIDRCVASDMYGNARALLNKAYDAATPSIAQPEQPADNDFDRALRKHETNCCMFERGVQTLDDLLRSRKAFIKFAQPKDKP